MLLFGAEMAGLKREKPVKEEVVVALVDEMAETKISTEEEKELLEGKAPEEKRKRKNPNHDSSGQT